MAIAPRAATGLLDDLQVRALIENATDLITIVEPDGTIAYQSPSVEHELGYHPRELVGEDAFDFVHTEDVIPLRAALAEVLQSPRCVRSVEFRFRHRDGTWRTLLGVGKNLVDDPYVRGVLVNSCDVSQRRLAQAELAASERKFRAMFENANDAVFLLDRDAVLDCNPVAERVFGWSRAQMVTRRPFDDSPSTQPDGRPSRAVGMDYVDEALAGRPQRFEWTCRRADGTSFDADVSLSCLDRELGTTLLAIVRDVTARRRAEQDLRQANARLSRALEDLKAAEHQVVQQERLRALGMMASGIAHDFNNSLTCVLGFSELLLALPDRLDDKAALVRDLRLMNTAAKDARGVVDRLRAFYRDRQPDEAWSAVDVNRVATEAVSLTEPKWKAEAQARGVSIDVRTDLAAVPTVVGDAAELREAVTNLLFNSIDALPVGGRIDVLTRLEAGDVVLAVRDNGTGMDDSVRMRCFDPFFSTKGARGSGLGLSMVYGALKRHDGRVDVQSELGRGTTITLRLPVAHRRSREELSPPTAQPHLARRLRVLLVDDDDRVREVLAKCLRVDGHEVLEVSDAALGRTALEREPVDLLVVDRALPRMSGDEFAEHAKRLRPGLPVMMLTGFGATMVAAGECPPGVDLVVGKPVTLDALRAAVAQLVKAS